MIANRYQPLEAARPGTPQRARDQKTAQTVMLREVGPIAEEQLGAALRRMRSATGIFHPSLITLFDVTEVAPGKLLLAYEFVPAQSIRQLTGGQPFHPRRAAELMSEIADAVAELHARPLIHGAISADTVLVTMKGKAKLDRVADPAFPVREGMDEDTDLRDIITLLRELTRGAQGALPVLDTILEHDDGASLGSAATLAASLRAAAAR